MTAPRLTRRSFLAAGAVALALPARALSRLDGGDGVRHVVRNEPLPHAARRPAAGPVVLDPRPAPRHDLLGLHWRGDGAVAVRAGGRWVEVHEEGGPDDGTRERSRPGWRLGVPVVTGGADTIELRLQGDVRALRAHYLAARPRRVRALAQADAPPVVTRTAWGADESIVRTPPYFADRLLFSVVHHTAGRAPASPEESATVVRAIQRYHAVSNGWNDIGYNALVDPFGQVFEGRGGGLERNVVGAHVRGFNTGSFGVAVIGNSETEVFTPEAHDAVVRLLAWRLDLAHVDPMSLLSFTTTGNERFASGAVVSIGALNGHRDLGDTSCPGANVYTAVAGLGTEVYAAGLPKLFDPRVEGTAGAPVRFTARLSEERDWVVRVADASGAIVAEGSGRSTTVDWTWDATAAPPGPYSFAIEAGEGIRPAAGAVEAGGAPAPPPAPPPPPPPPPRPGRLPKRIPRWAWQLHRWQSTSPSVRGRRPRAPRPVPSWYWRWRAWRLAVERAKAR